MFWGLNLKPNRKYTQTTTKSFHISQAALDADSSSSDGANQIFISCENQKFLICTLRKDSCEQVMLDLNFAEGDEICFQSIGSGNVSLSGYLLLDEDSMNLMDGDEEEDEESEVEIEEDLRNALNKKAKAKKEATGNGDKVAKAAKAKVTAGADEDDDEDDEDDSDFNAEALLDGDVEEGEEDESDDDEDEEDSDEDEDDDDEEEDESEDEEVQEPKTKQAKLEKPQNQQNGIAKEAAGKKGKKDKKGKKENQAQQQQQQPQQKQQQKAGGERVITGGVKIEDLRVGNGPEAKTGKRAQVYYEGRLKTNNKVFDSMKQGAGFKFGLGKGEVIKGWDVGVVGMKVGGKRRITCPPHMAYGARGSPPTIPPNSTLVFDVELKGVN